MKRILTCMAAIGLIASLGIASAPGALAKAHDSGVSDGDPSGPPQGGRNADAPPGTSTSNTAQGFGSPAMGDTISGAAKAGDEPGFSEGKGTFGGSDPGFGGGSESSSGSQR